MRFVWNPHQATYTNNHKLSRKNQSVFEDHMACDQFKILIIFTSPFMTCCDAFF